MLFHDLLHYLSPHHLQRDGHAARTQLFYYLAPTTASPHLNIHSQNDGHTSLHLSTYVKALRSCLCSDSTSYGRPLMLPFRRLFFAFAAFAAFAAAALAERFDNIASVARRLLLPLPRGVAMLPVWCMIWYM
jgi:hypothetical protein